jgi:ATP-dependent Clp protease protease subunit
MQHNKLLNLLRNNARQGEFRAEGNTIYLYDVIVSSKADAEWFGGVDAETFVQTVRGMSGDIALRINSPGGDVFASRAMAQAIRDHKGTVTAYVDGYAASAASFLTSVSDKTVMSQGSMIMIHKAWSIALGNSDDFMATAVLLDKIDGTIAETYAAAAERRGAGSSDWSALMAAETWMTAQEAIDAGLADEIAADSPKSSAKWDLSAYEHAPVQDELEVSEESGEEILDPDESPDEAAAIAQNEIERMRRVSAIRLKEAA